MAVTLIQVVSGRRKSNSKAKPANRGATRSGNNRSQPNAKAALQRATTGRPGGARR